MTKFLCHRLFSRNSPLKWQYTTQNYLQRKSFSADVAACECFLTLSVLQGGVVSILPNPQAGGPPNIVRVIKSRRMRWAGHVARMGEERGV